MWKDNLTGATYTQAQYETMSNSPVYKRLVARLVQIESAPEPVQAATKEPKKGKNDRIDIEATISDNSDTNG